MDHIVIFRQHSDFYLVTFPGLPITPFTALNPIVGLEQAREMLESYKEGKKCVKPLRQLIKDLKIGDFIVEMEV